MVQRITAELGQEIYLKKKRYREYLIKKRNSISKEENIKVSQKILSRLFNLPEYQEANNIILYCGKEKEVQTEEIIKQSLNAGKRIVVPITNVEKRILNFSEIYDFDKDLEISTFNVYEPKKSLQKPFNINDANLVIVPGVGFDVEGVRLGYGHGYYDKFLSNLNDLIPIIGLAFECQIVEVLPMGKNDVKVHKILTEEKIINCNRKE